jgi:XTP/dITP diphosphohydrolase
MASSNLGKLRELTRILGEFDFALVAQSEFGIDDADENGDSFIANALIKARHAASLTGLPAIADDSGLVVDALDGRPGVYSARYAGADASDAANVDKLLLEMASVDDGERGAAFHCTACFVTPDDQQPLIATGIWRGTITRQRRGAAGFGYDPVFLDPELGVTAAELSSEQKNLRSHRGKALAELATRIRSRQ